MVGLTTIRIVWFSNVGDGGSPGNGNGACIAVLHALTQCPPLLAGSAQAAGMTTARAQIRTTACFVFAISCFRTFYLTQVNEQLYPRQGGDRKI
jgi:hypothetical protein